MKRTAIMFAGLLLVGCQDIESDMTEEQAKAFVLEHHGGTVEIVSVTKEWNKYIVAWENESNCEWGTDTVNKKGEVETQGRAIC
ncbi:hypothetical protein [Rossellomorea sp. YZS02]|uniref:hypothetical protein n=1 Tax=Rossellomorea sp. YZS02 TaxID=3097358 RepID=UPI002A14A801|nr:hypothetical protein [Rossellomorea sp. YZS02]MDX8342457.1 hypothetical protein [Rossellomorea sp. YZS02]